MPYATFSRTVPSNRIDSCGTTDTNRRYVRRSRVFMSAPSSSIRPEVGRMKPMTRLSTVDFPAPDAPTSAMVSPGATDRSKSRTAGRPASSYA